MRSLRLLEEEDGRLKRIVAQQAPDIDALRDVAMHAGANYVGEVASEVIDRAAHQAKAGAASLAKARKIAEQMSQGLNAKLGPLVYASNKAPTTESLPLYEALATSNASVSVTKSGAESEKPGLVLFPQKVKESATVHPVFAVE